MLNYHIGYFVYILGVRNTFKNQNIKCKVIEKSVWNYRLNGVVLLEKLPSSVEDPFHHTFLWHKAYGSLLYDSKNI